MVKEGAKQPDGSTAPSRSFDMFRNRAIFPIIDQYGNVLAFGGRTMGDQQPKYLNTSDTPVFNKRLGVYAANLLRKERHLARVILVEGYMDVVSLTQFGVAGVVATGYRAHRGAGPAAQALCAAGLPGLRRRQRRPARHPRGLEILEQEGVPARVLDFPDGLDPDEFIRRDGPEAFAALPAISPPPTACAVPGKAMT